METIRIEQKEDIVVIKLNRPGQRNALNRRMLVELREAVSILREKKDMRCAIVTGSSEGKAFAAGADISEMQQMTFREAEDFARFGCETFRMLEELEQPVIAAINGYALGGGLELALACDLRVACTTAMLGLPETTLGIMPGFGGAGRLKELIGYANAAELIFTGKQVEACKARELGLLNAVWETETFWENTVQLAQEMCANAPYGVRNAKKTMKKTKGDELETLYFARLFLTKDQKTGMENFVKKQKTKHFWGE